MNIVEKSYDFRRPLVPRKKTDFLIFHHVGPMPSGEVNGDVVHDWHRNRKTSSGRYWNGIGYNAIILKNGTIEEGRPFEMQGAHTSGANSNSFGVLVVGNFEQDSPEPIQVEKAIEFAKYVTEELYPSIKRIGGHSDFGSSACPGKHFPLQEIKREVEENLTWQQEQTISQIEKLAEMGYLNDPDMHIEAVIDVNNDRKVRDYVLISLISRLAERIETL